MININLAVAQQSIPILNSTSRLQHYSSLAYLLECPKFVIDKNPKTEEEIDNVFNYVLNNTNEFIHNIEQETIFLNPFMIAISYIHKMMHTPREDHLCLTDNRFGNILFARNIDKIMEELQNARLLDTSCIAGLPFLTDEKSYRGAHYDHFIQVGARCIGAEERSDETLEMDMLKGSAYFVARQYVAFAIHHKFTLFPKQSAEFNRVYTISFYRPDPFEICSDVTVTTRTFDMLQSVGKTIQSLFITWAAPTKSERESTTILVCLGMKEYRIDKLLYILACALRAERYLIEFLFYMQDCTTSEQDTTKIMVDEEKWKKAGGSADERKSILTLKNTGRWTIAVTFIGTAKYVPDDILVGRMYSMTVPIPDNGSNDRLSIEVIENENCSVGLYQFCEHLILDLLPKLVGVQLPAPAPPVQRQDPPYIGAPKPDPDRQFSANVKQTNYECVGRSFIEAYYKSFDYGPQETRASRLREFYTNDSYVTFEGFKWKGCEEIVQKLSEFEFKRIDRESSFVHCQPADNGKIRIAVLGTLKIDGKPEKLFSHSIICHPDNNGDSYIGHEILSTYSDFSRIPVSSSQNTIPSLQHQ